MKDYVLKFEQSLFKVGINSSGELAVIFRQVNRCFRLKPLVWLKTLVQISIRAE